MSAGEAFKRLATDPKTKLARERLKAWASALKAEAPAIEAELRKLEDEWQTQYGRDYPRDMEDVVRLFVEAGASPEMVLKGTWTYRDVFPIIEGYLARLKAGNANPTAKAKGKRSTERGDGPVKLIPALTKHHQYANGGCLNQEPIGNNELARVAGVANRTASAFFAKEFKGHANYKTMCNDKHRLIAALKALNSEFRPHEFINARTPDQVEREDE